MQEPRHCRRVAFSDSGDILSGLATVRKDGSRRRDVPIRAPFRGPLAALSYAPTERRRPRNQRVVDRGCRPRRWIRGIASQEGGRTVALGLRLGLGAILAGTAPAAGCDWRRRRRRRRQRRRLYAYRSGADVLCARFRQRGKLFLAVERLRKLDVEARMPHACADESTMVPLATAGGCKARGAAVLQPIQQIALVLGLSLRIFVATSTRRQREQPRDPICA